MNGDWVGCLLKCEICHTGVVAEKRQQPFWGWRACWGPSTDRKCPWGTKARLSSSPETIEYLEGSQHQNSTLALQDIFEFYVSPLTGSTEKVCFMNSLARRFLSWWLLLGFFFSPTTAVVLKFPHSLNRLLSEKEEAEMWTKRGLAKSKGWIGAAYLPESGMTWNPQFSHL